MLHGNLLIIVNIIDVQRVACVEPKHNPPDSRNPHCPKAFESSFQWMKQRAGKIHVAWFRGRVQEVQNITKKLFQKWSKTRANEYIVPWQTGMSAPPKRVFETVC